MKTTLLLGTALVIFSVQLKAQNFEWVDRAGDVSTDLGFGIVADNAGYTYSCGSFSDSVDFDPGPGVAMLNSYGLADAYVLKLDPAGNYVWAIQLGGTSNDVGRTICLDASGHFYLGGSFWLTADFDPGVGSFNLTTSGFEDFFVSKYDTTGNLIWAKSGGGPGLEITYGISVDGSGNVLASGMFSSTCNFDPGASNYSLTSNGNLEAHVMKFDNNGNFMWARGIGGTQEDRSYAVTTDAAGSVYFAGYLKVTVDLDPGPGTSMVTAIGFEDIFVVKLNASGNFVWGKHLGSGSQDIVWGMCSTPTGIILTGNASGVIDFDPGVGVVNLTSNGVSDVFIWQLDTAGNFLLAKNMGGNSGDLGQSVTTDNFGNIYCSGYIGSAVADFDPGAGTFNLINAGVGRDIFISKLDPAGNFLWAGSIGDTLHDLSYGVDVDNAGNIFATGYFTGTADFDPAAAIYPQTSAGGYDAFVIKLNQCSIDTSITATTLSLTSNAADSNYQWVDCNNGFAIIPGDTNQVFMPTVNGSYAVIITQSNCVDTSSCYAFISTGVTDFSTGEIAIVPNPGDGVFHIVTTQRVIDKTTVFNSTGEIVFESAQVSEIDLSLQPAGIYVVIMHTELGIVCRKLVVY